MHGGAFAGGWELLDSSVGKHLANQYINELLYSQRSVRNRCIAYYYSVRDVAEIA
jgi:hypothetical protein